MSVSMDWQDIGEKETFYQKIYGSEHRKGVETFPRENMPWWHYDQKPWTAKTKPRDSPPPHASFRTHRDMKGHTLTYLDPHVHCRACAGKDACSLDSSCALCEDMAPWARASVAKIQAKTSLSPHGPVHRGEQAERGGGDSRASPRTRSTQGSGSSSRSRSVTGGRSGKPDVGRAGDPDTNRANKAETGQASKPNPGPPGHPDHAQVGNSDSGQAGNPDRDRAIGSEQELAGSQNSGNQVVEADWGRSDN